MRVMVVGESYGENEEELHARTGRVSPFVGKSGALLNSMLARAGIPRETCFVTNVVNRRPPENKLEGKHHAWWTDKKGKAKKFGCTHFAAGYFFNDLVRRGLDDLAADIRREQPEVIVALGNLALWGLCGHSGVANWRGSELWWQGPLADETAPAGAAIPGTENSAERLVQNSSALANSTIAVVPTYP